MLVERKVRDTKREENWTLNAPNEPNISNERINGDQKPFQKRGGIL
jgi:hypothetical protein